jgi:gluconate 2-dehydrogenase gamma chain
MNNHDENRRAFLVGTVVGAGALAGTALLPDAVAQTTGPPGTAKGPPVDHANMGHGAQGAFLNDEHLATIAAFAERLMPGAPGKPGARDAGVLNYIDLALAGAYADQQDFYRRGLAALDAYCRKTFKAPFRQLAAAEQDQVITALEQGKASEFTWPTQQAFFNTLRTHTMEGMFADPVYGGNKNFAGWQLLAFPGAQPLFSPADMQSGKAFTREPMIGLQAQARRT